MMKFLLLLGTCCGLFAADLPYVHPLFADHCVLQRGRPVPVWGWAEAGAEVTVSIAGKEATGVADANGRWQATLPTLEAGGPYELTISGPQSVTISDVLIGEVWICSGQSNMEQGIAIARDPQEEIAAADHPRLRLCWVKHHISIDEEAVTDMSWLTCTPENIAKQGGWGGFSAAGYFFGRKLLQELDVPIGLVHSSWGGTPAQAWISSEGLAPLNDFADSLAALTEIRKAGGEDDYAQRLAAWWAKTDPGSAGNFHESATDTADWKSMDLPGNWESKGLEGVDGVVWFRRSVDIPAAWDGKDLVLNLAKIDDQDTTWIDGKQVGAMQSWNQSRSYRIAAGSVPSGQHVIAIRVLDTGGGGGVYGDASEMSIAPVDAKDQAISLAGAWTYKATVTDPQLVRSAPRKLGDNPNYPTVLSNGMIEPLVPLAVAGAIWYQGESNAGNAVQYRSLLPTLIADWRRRFANDNLFFGIVQLASFLPRVEDPVQDGWAALREAQSITANNDPLASLAVAIDIGDAADIHPKNKQDVGLRLALGALKGHYGLDLVASGPAYEAMKVEGTAVRLEFTDADGLTTSDNEAPKAFALSGPDGVWHHAAATIDGTTIVLTADGVSEPRAVRYAWANNPAVNLTNGAGLPAVPFRSDGP
jgi:sialate O-acetylesterase